jgi:uncharacterized membrane protein YgcG
MWESFGSLSVVPWILFAQMSWDMSAVPVITAAPPPTEVAAEVRDRGEVFSRAAERRAQEALRRIHRDYRIPVSIETIKSLDGAWIADVAGRRARAADADQLYILVAGSERDVGVIAARHGPASHLTDQQRETIRRAFLGPLQAGETDGALEQGVRAIGTTLADPATAEPKSEVWGLLIAMTLLLGFWAVVYAARIGANYMDWGRWRRGKAARAAGEPPTPHLTPVASVVQAAETSVASCVTSR